MNLATSEKEAKKKGVVSGRDTLNTFSLSSVGSRSYDSTGGTSKANRLPEMACLVSEYLGETPFTHEFDGRHSSIRQTWTKIAEGEIAQFRKRSKALRTRPSRNRFSRLSRNSWTFLLLLIPPGFRLTPSAMSWTFISVNRVTRRPSN